MSIIIDNSSLVSSADNKSCNTLVKDITKGIRTKRRYYHDMDINHENESANILMKDLVKRAIIWY